MGDEQSMMESIDRIEGELLERERTNPGHLARVMNETARVALRCVRNDQQETMKLTLDQVRFLTRCALATLYRVQIGATRVNTYKDKEDVV